jgi:hypothetical protein
MGGPEIAPATGRLSEPGIVDRRLGPNGRMEGATAWTIAAAIRHWRLIICAMRP